MRPIAFRLLVATSLLMSAPAEPAVRPRYGGTLHMAMQSAPVSLDPADFNQWNGPGLRSLAGLLFETLTFLDAQGGLKPGLASSWQADPGNQRWRFYLRAGVTYADGTPLSPESVAASLRRNNASWKVSAAADAIVIERDSPAPFLPAELALLRNSVIKRDGGQILGTGPFVVSQWNPGKKLVLTARDQYWGGRVYLDTVDVDLGRNPRDQMMAFDSGQAQLVEVPAEQARKAAVEGRHVTSSSPTELMALVFDHASRSEAEAHQRQALALSIDRDQINSVVLQAGGEPAGALLPAWMTGYGFIFPAKFDLTAAQQERAEVPQAGVWTLSVDANDPVARVVAERIILGARDAGLRLQLATAAAADVRLLSVPLVSLEPHVAMIELAAALGLPAPAFSSGSVDDLYTAENALLQTHQVISLLHLRRVWAAAPGLRGWTATGDGSWHLGDAWLAAGAP